MPKESRRTRTPEAKLRKFKNSLTGEVIFPGDARYERARRVWNHDIDRRPALIARCTSTDDVVSAVTFARESGMLAAVRGGGHSFAGHGACERGIVIDLSFMKRASIDPIAGTVTIQPGVTAGELDYITQAFGMAIPLGSCPSVGVTGYAMGGGEGALTPKFGYGCDSIIGAEIVTAGGRVLSVSARENKDLFWAIRGGGGNFGIATRLDFRLSAIERVLAGHLRYPIRDARRMLTFLGQYAPTLPDEMYLLAAVLPFPGERMLDLSIVWCGDEKDGERVLAPIRGFQRPAQDSIESKPYLDEQRGGSDSPSEGDWSTHRRGGHLSSLSAEAIETIVAHASSAPTESSGITLAYWHGPWASGEHDNAFGFRREGFEYWIHSYWQEERERERSIAWVEEFFSAIEPHSTGAVYVNDLQDEGEERVRAAYGDKYPRLQRLKRKYDPDNFFRVNQNIKPAR